MIELAVWFVLYILGAAAIIGLLFYVVSYCEIMFFFRPPW